MVFELLKQGAENAVTAKRLTQACGLNSARDLQNVIAKEREAGCAILSTCRNGGGYFLADDGDKGQRELQEFINTLRARAINTLKAAIPAKAALEHDNKQTALDGFEGR